MIAYKQNRPAQSKAPAADTAFDSGAVSGIASGRTGDTSANDAALDEICEFMILCGGKMHGDERDKLPATADTLADTLIYWQHYDARRRRKVLELLDRDQKRRFIGKTWYDLAKAQLEASRNHKKRGLARLKTVLPLINKTYDLMARGTEKLAAAKQAVKEAKLKNPIDPRTIVRWIERLDAADKS